MRQAHTPKPQALSPSQHSSHTTQIFCISLHLVACWGSDTAFSSGMEAVWELPCPASPGTFPLHLLFPQSYF